MAPSKLMCTTAIYVGGRYICIWCNTESYCLIIACVEQMVQVL